MVSFNGIALNLPLETTLTLDRNQVPVKLRQGEVLMANVKAVLSDNKAIIEIDGRTLVAETKTSLFPGQQLLLEVKGSTTGQMVQLAVIADSAKTIGQLADMGAFAELFTKGNIEPNKVNKQIAAELLAQGLPAAPEDIKEIARIVQQEQPEQFDKAVAAAVMLKAKALPITKTNLAQAMSVPSTREVLAGFAKLGKDLVKMAQEQQLPGIEFGTKSMVRSLVELSVTLKTLVQNELSNVIESTPQPTVNLPSVDLELQPAVEVSPRRSGEALHGQTTESEGQGLERLQQLTQKLELVIAELELTGGEEKRLPTREPATVAKDGLPPNSIQQGDLSVNAPKVSQTAAEGVMQTVPPMVSRSGSQVVAETLPPIMFDDIPRETAIRVPPEVKNAPKLEVKLGTNRITPPNLARIDEILHQVEELVTHHLTKLETGVGERMVQAKQAFQQFIQVIAKEALGQTEVVDLVKVEASVLKDILLGEEFKLSATKELAKVVDTNTTNSDVASVGVQLDKISRQLEAAEVFYPRGFGTEADKVYYLPFPLNLDGRHYENELYFAKQHQDATSDSPNQGLHILFLLETPSMGALKIDMRCILPKVSLDFTVRDNEVAQLLKGDLEFLESRFRELGLELQLSRVLVAKPSRSVSNEGVKKFDQISGIDIRV